jgi:hypothetical protein
VALARELVGTPTIVTLCADIRRKSAPTNESILPLPGLHLGHERRNLVNMSPQGEKRGLTSAENPDAFLFWPRGNKWLAPSVSFLSGPIDGRPIRSEITWRAIMTIKKTA